MNKTIGSLVLLMQLSAGIAVAAPLTDRERQRLISHLDMSLSWLTDEVSSLSPDQLAFRRAPDAWTILEVLDHLVVVGPIYWQDLQSALKEPGGRTSPSTDADILWYGIDRTNREKAIPSEVPKGLRDFRSGLDAHRKNPCTPGGVHQIHEGRSSGPHRRTTEVRWVPVGAAHFHTRTAAYSPDSRDQGGSQFPEEIARWTPESVAPRLCGC